MVRSGFVTQEAIDAARDAHALRMGGFRSGSHLITGVRFVATLQLRTPLAILERDGLMRALDEVPEPDFPLWAGIWSPVAKTFRDIGLDIDEPRDIRATHIGPQDASEFLPFLKAVRWAVEQASSRDQAVFNVRAVALNNRWADFIHQFGGPESVVYHSLAFEDEPT